MSDHLTRRTFFGTAGASAAGMLAATAAGQESTSDRPAGRLKIVGIACSPREPSTTAASVQVALEAAKEIAPEQIDIELVKLAGLRINGAVAAGIPLEADERDDFPAVAEKLSDPAVAGLIIGSPVYFGNMSSLCKAFLERLMVFRRDNFALSNKVAGVLAVGGARNGGQELTIQSIQAALFCQELIIVGETRPSSHFGPGVWNNKDFAQVTDDEIGMTTVKSLGRRVAQVARLVARTA
jgi:multimeric flavodoxin WrbA